MQELVPCFIIIERDSFIASDLRCGLHDACPGCLCLRTPDLDGCMMILRHLDDRATRPVIITKLSIAEIEACGLGAMAAARGWRLVLRLGGDTIEAVRERGWFSLPAPFSSDDVAVLVQALQAHARPPLMRRA
ncbi:hypothetical protein KY389_07215 [Paracoccus bogoriensis]|uniref:hypothetical protein n=1 Tax=Paracoccus bogoriensis TaxID=242065 RepID=UPI001CA5C5DF|nr:hypothetical protein [Paracoccus bogoriensis]MBW7056483.1 hypothetical protein [Paracoccus bogoriensis]